MVFYSERNVPFVNPAVLPTSIRSQQYGPQYSWPLPAVLLSCEGTAAPHDAFAVACGTPVCIGGPGTRCEQECGCDLVHESLCS